MRMLCAWHAHDMHGMRNPNDIPGPDAYGQNFFNNARLTLILNFGRVEYYVLINTSKGKRASKNALDLF